MCFHMCTVLCYCVCLFVRSKLNLYFDIAETWLSRSTRSKRTGGNTSPADVAKKKRIKKELNQTVNEQEEIENRRRHKGDKLNLWKEEDMENVVKE